MIQLNKMRNDKINDFKRKKKILNLIKHVVLDMVKKTFLCTNGTIEKN